MTSSVPDIYQIAQKVPPHVAIERRREVARLLGRDSIQFPGAQPISFARRHLNELRQRDYYVCEKSDGIRCLLFFTSEFDPAAGGAPREMHYLIDRKNDYYAVDDVGFHSPLAPNNPAEQPVWDSFHVETLLDGELIVDTEPNGQRVTKYYVFDTLAVDGRPLLDRPLDKRLAYFVDKVYRPYEALCNAFPDDARAMAFQLRQKAFELSYGTKKLFDETIPRLKHGSDGVIFTCRETPYTFGTDHNILKWKPAEENTVDFRMCMTFPPLDEERAAAQAAQHPEGAAWDRDYDAMPSVTLYINHGDRGGYEAYAPLHLEDSEWASMRQYAVDHQDGIEGAVVECRRDTEGRWRFGRFREDKEDGNHVSVVQKVVESIEDGVAKDELVANEPDVRTAWKAREARRRAEAPRQGAARPS